MTDYPEIARLAKGRSHCYSLLSASFSMPTVNLVSTWMNTEVVVSLFGEQDLLPLHCSGWKEIESFIGRGEGEQGLLQELSQSYVRLFFASPHFIAPPYESVYVEGGFLMGEATVKVNRIYSQEGVDLSPGFKDLPDHIAAELEFMALLSEREAAFWNHGVRDAVEQIIKEESFLREHLCTWLPHFSRRLKKAEESFYSALATITDSFAQVDLLRLWALQQSLSGLAAILK